MNSHSLYSKVNRPITNQVTHAGKKPNEKRTTHIDMPHERVPICKIEKCKIEKYKIEMRRATQDKLILN